MKTQQIENSIRNSIALNTPDLFDKIASTPIQKLSEEDYIVRELPRAKQRFTSLQKVYALCSSMAMILVICFGFFYNNNTVDSIIAIDVNPSVEISLNKSYKVLSVRANNIDGEKLIENKNFKNQGCDDVIADLTTSLSKQGYINKNKNSILVSVSSPNEVKAAEVKSRVVTDIKTTLHKEQIEPVIYNQSIPNKDTSELDKLAKKYHISFGKMKLIHSLIEKDPTLTIKELAELPIQEIPNYVEERQIQIADVIDCDQQIQVANRSTSTKEVSSSTTDTSTTVSTTETSTVTSSSTISVAKQEPKKISETDGKIDVEKNTEVIGIVTPKTCNNCTPSCTCPNCTLDNGCPNNCNKCPSNCNNATATNGTTDNSVTNSTSSSSQTGTTETNKKPSKDDNTESGYEILDPEDTDDLENSGLENEPTTSTSKEEDDLTSSGTMDSENSSTEMTEQLEEIEE